MSVELETKTVTSKKEVILKREELISKGYIPKPQERMEFWDINNPTGFLLYAKRDNSGRIMFDEVTGRPLIIQPSYKVVVRHNPDTGTDDRIMVEGDGFLDLIQRQERIADEAYRLQTLPTKPSLPVHPEDKKKYQIWFDKVKGILKSVGDKILNDEIQKISPSEMRKKQNVEYRKREKDIFGHLSAKERKMWKEERDELSSELNSLRAEWVRVYGIDDKREREIRSQMSEAAKKLNVELEKLDRKYGIVRESQGTITSKTQNREEKEVIISVEENLSINDPKFKDKVKLTSDLAKKNGQNTTTTFTFGNDSGKRESREQEEREQEAIKNNYILNNDPDRDRKLRSEIQKVIPTLPENHDGLPRG